MTVFIPSFTNISCGSGVEETHTHTHTQEDHVKALFVPQTETWAVRAVLLKIDCSKPLRFIDCLLRLGI